MSRIPLLKREELDAEQGRVYDSIAATSGRVGGGPSIGYMYAPGLWEVNNAVSSYFDKSSSLTPLQVRLVALVTIRHWNSAFPWAAQARMGLQAGLDEAAVAAINNRQRPTLKNAEDQIIHDVASEMIKTGTLNDATFTKARDTLGTRRLVDTVGLVGQFCKTAMMANLAGAEAPADAPSQLK